MSRMLLLTEADGNVHVLLDVASNARKVNLGGDADLAENVGVSDA